MKFLRENGYRTLPLSEAVRYIVSGTQPSEPAVVLTFDDGFHDFLTHAFPILHEHEMVATVFLPTAYIADQRLQFKNYGCLTWTEVRELHRAGVTFGSHTVTHPQLRTLNSAEVEQEVRRSKETIEDKLGHPTDSFSYPFAFPETDPVFKRVLKELLTKHGYKTGVSTVIGTSGAGDDALFLPRLGVNSWDDVRFFQSKLQGSYDWLRTVQYATKIARFRSL
jgi:peptidoglycan/xylan/chitin deacetylase (PgdA/CDA1 family)